MNSYLDSMRRLLFDELISWKDSSDRKPLMLMGVRQCGKTYLLTQLGEEQFEDYIYCNLEQSPELKRLFEPDLDPHRIVEDLELLKNKKVIPGKTLLILDEIQECDNAITSLKYFEEYMGDLHVACAGSLLGVTMSESSFPVGKVDTKHLYPMNFIEFLMATGESSLAEFLMSDPKDDAISEPIHESILRKLRDFCIVGGMPAVVESWSTEHDIRKVDSIQKELLNDYRKDFAKHGKHMVDKLTSVWVAIPSFLSRESHKVVFKDLKKDGRSDDFADPVQWLENAGMVYKANLIKRHAYPPVSEEDDTSYKLYFCDVGLLRAMAGHPAGIMLTEDDDTHLYKGGMYENLAVSELISSGSGRLFYWKDGKYEVDLIASIEGRTVPIEVKSGTDFDTISLNFYQRKYKVERSVVISKRLPKSGDREFIPFYCAGNLFRRKEETVVDDYEDATGFPFEYGFSKSDWTKDAGVYRIVIPGSVHHRGHTPSCSVIKEENGSFSEVHVVVTYAGNGDITISSSRRFAGKAVIRNRFRPS